MHPFVKVLKSVAVENCFNPYSDRCPKYDKKNAPSLRANSLSQIVYAAQQSGIDSIWIGRDLGYRGGRRTGLALTDDVHVKQHLKRFDIELKIPTNDEIVAERTASVIWRMLSMISDGVFLWNVFPFHPHEVNNPFSNRQHNARERAIGTELLRELVEILQPKKLVCIGNDAEAAVARLDLDVSSVKVRHPSYGGQADFERQITDLYSLQSNICSRMASSKNQIQLSYV